MADRSKIEWTDASWTPIRARRKSASAQVGDRGWRSALPGGKLGWHCEHVTAGCENCYAERMNKRLGTGLPFKPGHRKDVDIFLDDEMLTAPLRWRKPRMIFVCSMSDLFADFVKDEWIDRVFAVMALAPQHTFQVLTKRAERMREYVSDRLRPSFISAKGLSMVPGAEIEKSPAWNMRWPLSNVWLGVSCERQPEWDERKEHLRATPAAVHFASFEPLLGSIIERRPLSDYIQWAIVGGESGPDARPMHPDWARALRDQCAASGVPFFFKQWGEHALRWLGDRSDGMEMERVGKKAAGRLLDGVEHNGMPGRQMREAAA
jgi:protein gp37